LKDFDHKIRGHKSIRICLECDNWCAADYGGSNLKVRDSWWNTSTLVTCAPDSIAALPIALDIKSIPPSTYLYGINSMVFTLFVWTIQNYRQRVAN